MATNLERDPLVLDQDEESRGQGQRTRLIILGIVVLAALAYMVYAAFPGNTLYFLTVSEFVNGTQYQNGQPVRVSGALVPESFQRNPGTAQVNFQLVNKDGSSTETILNASYMGVVPDLFFDPHSEIILQGKLEGNGENQVFAADNILVKCPSKYQSEEEALLAGEQEYEYQYRESGQ